MDGYFDGTLTRCGVLFQDTLNRQSFSFCRSYNPGKVETSPVWANPVSLATTPGVSVDVLSSGY